MQGVKLGPSSVGDRMIEAARRNTAAMQLNALKSRCRSVEHDPDIVGVYSTGERCMVAIILDDPKLLPPSYTFLDAFTRLTADEVQLCLDVRRSGWR